MILIDALVATLNVSFSRYGASSERLQDVLSHACKQSYRASSSGSEVLVGPGTNMVLGLSKGGSLVVLTGPLDVLSVTTCSHILAPRSSILRARSKK